MANQTTLTATDAILDILRAATIDATGIKLNGQLERKEYEAVNKFLTTAGAAWNSNAKNPDGSKGRHLFSTPAAHEKLMALLETGTIRDDKKHYQQFYTPDDLASEIVLKYLPISDGADRILEPSAGGGAFCRAVRRKEPTAHVTAVEIDSSAISGLHACAHHVICADFLTLRPADDLAFFNGIVMNPPFTAVKGIGPQDIAHTLHALKFLKPGGTLVGLCSAGSKQEDALRPMANLWRTLERGTFRESGTEVPTVVFRIDYYSYLKHAK